jgi:Ca2+-binding RTX toxin-like protein
MTTIAESYKGAELALAAYSTLTPGIAGKPYTDALEDNGRGMSPAQAANFAERWQVVEQYNGEVVYEYLDESGNPQQGTILTGLSVTVFQEVGGTTRFLAVRGTEIESNDLVTDIFDIGVIGTPERQAQYAALKDKVGMWLGNGTLSPGFTVSGHSLGGFLAGALLVDYPTQIGHAYLYNAPGIGGAGANMVAALRLLTNKDYDPSLDLPKVTNLRAEGGGSMISGLGISWGTPVPINIEVSLNPFANHSIIPLTDSLAFHALLASIDSTVSVDSANKIERAASTTQSDSLEKGVESIYKLFKGTSVSIAAGDRNAFYSSLFDAKAAIDPTAAFVNLQLVSLADASAASLVTLAGSDVAYRYALRELNPFVVTGLNYSQHNPNGELNLFADSTTTPAGMTNQYIADRATMLAFAMTANTNDTNAFGSNQVSDQVRYTDMTRRPDGTSTDFVVFLPGGTANFNGPNTRRIGFGTDSADILRGRDNSDRLYGGRGTDFLWGGANNDYLEGGAGLDVYNYNASTLVVSNTNDGDDEIRDTDGKGVLRYTYSPTFGGVQSMVIGGAALRVTAAQWKSADGRFTYDQQGSTGLLITINGDAGGSLMLRDFDFAKAQTEGYLGIRLVDTRATPADLRTPDLVGDLQALDSDTNQAGVQLSYDVWGNVATISTVEVREDTLYGHDETQGDLILAGGGNDVIYGDTVQLPAPGARTNPQSSSAGSADWIQAGEGRDRLVAGPGDDLVEAGADGAWNGDTGGDIVEGGDGADEIFAETRIDLKDAITQGNLSNPTNLKGDFLSGQQGNDVLVGERGHDALMGGAGDDILAGGAGNDELFGDDASTASAFDWTVTHPDINVGGQILTVALFNNTVLGDPGTGGNDVIYAGSGNDFIGAGVGNDFVDAGSGNDVAYGQEGDDILIGADGNDVLVGDFGGGPNDGADFLDGGAGNDTLRGNGGDDILVGGAGTDILQGGAGRDIYVFDKSDVAGDEFIDDVIGTATNAEASLLVLNGVNPNDIKFRTGSLMIDLGDGGRIHLEGFDQLNPENSPLVGELRFDDGQVMSFADILAQGFDIDGTAGDDDGHDAAHPVLAGTGVVDRIQGFAGNDLLVGYAGGDTLDGGEGNDTLFGDGDDSGPGRQGNDTLTGGAGNDQIVGGGGGDALEGGDGDDQLFGDGDTVLVNEQGADTMHGGAGNDYLRGYRGDDLLHGEAGNDTYAFGAGDGKDVIEDLEGVNVVTFGPGVAVGDISLTNERRADGAEFLVVHYGANDRVAISGGMTGAVAQYAFDGGPVLSYAQLIDQAQKPSFNIIGTAGVDFLQGGLANDTIDGAAGDDILQPGFGNDTVTAGEGNDVVLGGSGDDTINGDAGADLLRGEAGNDVIHGGDGADTVHGEAGVDTLHGDAGADQLLGGEGDDTVDGGTGADGIWGQAGNDTLAGGAGDDEIDGGEGNDTLAGGGGDDLLAGGLGDDRFTFGVGDAHDTIDDAAGANRLVFGAGIALANLQTAWVGTTPGSRDLLVTISEADSVLIRGGEAAGHVGTFEFADGSTLTRAQLLSAKPPSVSVASVAFGTGGADSLTAHTGGSRLVGHGGNDTLLGREGVDELLGGSGNDTLSAEGGADVLIGGAGDDTLAGGDGDDSYRYAAGDGRDVITEAGSGADVLRFGDIARGDASFVRRAGGHLEVNLGGGGSVTVRDWYDSPDKRIERVEFSDGAVVLGAELEALAVSPVTPDGDGIVTGTAESETLLGDAASNVLDGLGGDDSLAGGAGADAYVLRLGMGRDSVVETGSDANALVLAPGLNATSLFTKREGDSLFVGLLGTGDGVLLEDYYTEPRSWNVVDAIGTATALDTIIGSSPGQSDEAYTAARYAEWLANANANFVREHIEFGVGYVQTGEASVALTDHFGTRVAAIDLVEREANDASLSRQSHFSDFTSQSTVETVVLPEGRLSVAAGNTIVDYSQLDSQGNPRIVINLGAGGGLLTTYASPQSLGLGTSGGGFSLNGQSYSFADLSGAAGPGVRVVSSVDYGLVAPLPPATRVVTQANAATITHLEILRAGDASNFVEFWDGGAVFGGAGNDFLYQQTWAGLSDNYSDLEPWGHPTQGGNFFDGGTGNDIVLASWSNDVIIVGDGNDDLAGGQGNDSYVVLAGKIGVTLIDEAIPQLRGVPVGFNATNTGSGYSTDTVVFGPGIAPEDLTIGLGSIQGFVFRGYAGVTDGNYQFDTLDISWGGSGSIRVVLPLESYTNIDGDGWGIENYRFQDGTVLTLDQLMDQFFVEIDGTAGNDSLHGGRFRDQVLGLDGGDVIYGHGDDDQLFGDAGDDNLFGGAGNDTLDGGPGIPNFLHGGPGDDVYVYGRGDAWHWVYQDDAAPGDIDAVAIEAGVSPAEVKVVRFGDGSPALAIDGSMGRLALQDWFDPESVRVKEVRFADGTIWDEQQIEMRALFGVTDGADTVFGSGAADSIDSYDGNDTVHGNEGDDVLDGGAGNDQLDGGPGDDTYLFGRAGGRDAIFEQIGGGGVDTLRFAAGISPDDVARFRQWNDLVFVLDSGERIDVRGWFVGMASIERVEFANGTVWDEAALAGFPFQTVGTEAADNIWATPNGDTILALGGNDYVNALEGNDVLDGGPGDDILVGGLGNDTYLFEAGSGFDGIDELHTPGSIDTVAFAPGVAPADVGVSRDQYNLFLNYDGGASRVGVSWFGIGAADPGSIERVEFDDGTVWDQAALEARIPLAVATPGDDALFGTNGVDGINGLGGDDSIYSDGGNDALSGGGGNDYLEGGRGNDLYLYNLGDGFDTLEEEDATAGNVDTLRFGAGIAPQDITVKFEYDPLRFEYDLRLELDDGGISIASWHFGRERQIERFEFADGTVWDVADIDDRLVIGPATEAGDVLIGTGGDDVIDGLGGADEIYGSEGNDVLDTGPGDDYAEGNAGNDVLIGGLGDDLMYGYAGNDILFGGEGIDDLEDWDVGNNLIDAGAGDDFVWQEGHTLVVGGAGDDWIVNYGDGSIIAFNAGDGNDTVEALGSLTLSLGDGIQPAALSLGKEGDDLLLSIGSGDSVRFADWYEVDPQGRPQITLQMFGSMHLYDFSAAIGEFDSALAGNPNLQQFGLDGVLQAHQTELGATQALGGAIAWWYATMGDTEGMPIAEIQSALAYPVFGTAPQPISLGSGNHAPILVNAIADQAVAEDADLSFTVPANTFVDIDPGDILTYTATRANGTALPEWVTFNPTTRVLSGNPVNGDVGEISVKITATDTSNASESATFNLTVTNINDWPEPANPIANQETDEDEFFSFAVPSNSFVDADPGDILTYTATRADDTALPGWVTFNPNTQVLSGTPVNGDVGTISVKVKATDLSNASVSDIFDLTVTNTNDVPTVENLIADQQAVADVSFSFTVPANIFADVDLGEDLIYTATKSDGSALPSWLVFDATTRTFSGTPPTGAGGNLDVRVTATDASSAAVSDVFTIAVSSIPVINGTAGNDSLTGTGGRERLNGLGGNDTLQGLGGDDELDGGTGDDTLNGGQGNDLYFVDSAGDVVTDSSGDADTVRSSITYALDGGNTLENLILVGTAAINATGNGDDNVLIGNGAANVLSGGGGADTLDGGAGADSMSGGGGNDQYFVDDLGDVVIESGSAIDTVNSSIAYVLGSNVENLTLTGSANINGTGNTLSNTLTGNSGANVLTGGAGSDTMSGGAGDDLYVADDLDTVMENAYEGTDLVQSTGSFVLGANVENLTLTGSSSINGTGNSEVNVILGNSGDNVLDGGGGADRLEGFAGNDTYVLDNLGDVLVDTGGTDTVQSSFTYLLSSDLENLTLTGSLAINGTGNSGANVITGNEAANVLDGGAGADTLDGGAGNDLYVIESTGDVVFDSGGGTDTVWSSVTYTLGGEIENLTLTGSSAINATGNSGANVLIGNSAANVLTASGGTDTLDGGAGADTMSGGGGNDLYFVDDTGDVVSESGGSGTDTVNSSVNYTLGSGVEKLTLTGSANINGTGNTLANTLTGNSGTNVLTGGAGADTMSGGAGDDTYVADDLDTVVENASEGTDLVQSSGSFTLGANVENLTLTGSASINGAGNSQMNVILGNAGDNWLDGGAGADRLEGFAGNDTYVLDDVGDVVVDTGGTDTVYSSFTYVLSAELENLALTGSLAINGTGNSGANVITGNGANNVLDGGAGADSMAGGAGNDVYVVDNAADTVTEYWEEGVDMGTDTVWSSISYTLGADLENLTLTGSSAINGTGNSAANVLIGNSAANVLTASGGTDTLDGGAGADTMIGGGGNDQYFVDDNSDVVTESSGAGTDTVNSSITYTLGSNVEKLTLTGSANIDGTGNTQSNTLTGNSGANVLTGGAGSDTMSGGAGDDTYVVDDQDTVVESANQGTDTVQAAFEYVLGANLENLMLTGSGSINGTGNALNNVLTGNSGANVLTGGAGDDTYVVGAGDTIVEGAGAGTDTVQSALSYVLGANLENITLTGSSSVDGTGNSLANTLTGNSGANILDGGSGLDTLHGGDGADKYILGRGHGSDVIQENDTNTSSIDTAQFLSGIATNQLWFQQSSNNLVVSVIGTADQFTIQDWYSGSAYHLEQFKTADGKTLLDSQVQNLVNAMASFSPPAMGQTTLPQNYADALNPVIAANWQ